MYLLEGGTWLLKSETSMFWAFLLDELFKHPQDVIVWQKHYHVLMRLQLVSSHLQEPPQQGIMNIRPAERLKGKLEIVDITKLGHNLHGQLFAINNVAKLLEA